VLSTVRSLRNVDPDPLALMIARAVIVRIIEGALDRISARAMGRQVELHDPWMLGQPPPDDTRFVNLIDYDLVAAGIERDRRETSSCMDSEGRER
jgi:hypothetical protein